MANWLIGVKQKNGTIKELKRLQIEKHYINDKILKEKSCQFSPTVRRALACFCRAILNLEGVKRPTDLAAAHS